MLISELGLMPSHDLAGVLSNQCKLADAVMQPSNALFFGHRGAQRGRQFGQFAAKTANCLV
jgi:hypothetical protein